MYHLTLFQGLYKHVTGFELINFKIWRKDIGHSTKNCLFIHIHEIHDFLDMHALPGITLLLILSKNKIAKDTSEFRNSFLKLKEWENECHLISLNSYC